MTEKRRFSLLIREAKSKLQLNHNQFADLIGHSRDTYIKWYKGDTLPYTDEIKTEVEESIKKALN